MEVAVSVAGFESVVGGSEGWRGSVVAGANPAKPEFCIVALFHCIFKFFPCELGFARFRFVVFSS